MLLGFCLSCCWQAPREFGKAVIQQAKIVRDKDRIDAKGGAFNPPSLVACLLTTWLWFCSGVTRSKRYGFVEFGSHDHALVALRALNNNPTVFNSFNRPIIEFALEDQR